MITEDHSGQFDELAVRDEFVAVDFFVKARSGDIHDEPERIELLVGRIGWRSIARESDCRRRAGHIGVYILNDIRNAVGGCRILAKRL